MEESFCSMKPIGLNLGIVFQSFHCSAKEKEHNQDINYSVFNDPLGAWQRFCHRFAIATTHNIHSGVFVNSPNYIVDSHRTYYLLFYPVAMISPSMAHQEPVHLVEESSGDEEDSKSDEHSSTETSAKEASIASSATPVLAHQETKAVNRSKSLVYLVLLVAAAAAATATYFFLAIEEQDDFESEVSNVFLQFVLGFYSVLDADLLYIIDLRYSSKVLLRISLTRQKTKLRASLLSFIV
jgi:hypothetical protein